MIRATLSSLLLYGILGKFLSSRSRPEFRITEDGDDEIVDLNQYENFEFGTSEAVQVTCLGRSRCAGSTGDLAI